jgi:elongator complex protein 6
MTSRFPPLLEPYLHFPSEAYFVLVTSVLGASSNWLVLRFLHSVFLVDDTAAGTADDGLGKVVFVSFVRDLSFWKENAKRIVGAQLLRWPVTSITAQWEDLAKLFLGL